MLILEYNGCCIGKCVYRLNYFPHLNFPLAISTKRTLAASFTCLQKETQNHEMNAPLDLRFTFSPIPGKLHLGTDVISATFSLINIVTGQTEQLFAVGGELLCYICILLNNGQEEMPVIHILDSLTVSQFRPDTAHWKAKWWKLLVTCPTEFTGYGCGSSWVLQMTALPYTGLSVYTAREEQ